MFRHYFCLLVIYALASCSGDIVLSKYATLQDAKSDDFMTKGWLPDFLPTTTVNIKASNNLDLNTSTGAFEFDSNEFPLFASKLHAHQPTTSPFHSWEEKIREKIASGYLIGEYNENEMTWVFLCSKARNSCEYSMWATRHG